MKKNSLLISALIFLSFAVTHHLFVVPQNWPKPVYNFTNNELTSQKILLGRVLFYDPALSADGTISCASCHSQFSAFTHVDHALSHGIHDSIGTRNSPALMNLAWQRSFMWDGAIVNLDMQSLAPIAHPAEMGSNISRVVDTLQESVMYRQLFYKAYGDSVVTGAKTLKALSQFMLTLVSANSKYDKVMRKEENFTGQETKGYKLFQQHCSSCHAEPLFTTGGFANNGLPVDSLLNDYGKYSVTKKSNDSLKFKIPTLRNVEFTYPYMHDGRFKTLAQVLKHYTGIIQHTKTLAPELKAGINLTSEQKVDLTAFLLTLSDKEFMFNKNFSFPKEVLLRK